MPTRERSVTSITSSNPPVGNWTKSKGVHPTAAGGHVLFPLLFSSWRISRRVIRLGNFRAGPTLNTANPQLILRNRHHWNEVWASQTAHAEVHWHVHPDSGQSARFLRYRQCRAVKCRTPQTSISPLLPPGHPIPKRCDPEESERIPRVIPSYVVSFWHYKLL